MNLMIVTNSRYLAATRVMLYSFFQNHKGAVTVYLPYEDLTEAELKQLGEFCSSWEGKKLVPLYVGTDFKEEVRSRNGIMVETYYRILGWKLLPPEVHRILYLDVDMVINGSLDELYQTDFKNAVFAVCEDIFGIINGFHQGNKARLGLGPDRSYFNAGMLLVNVDELRRTSEVEKILAQVYKDYERYEYNDQDVLNEMYQDRLIYVGWDQYNCPPAWYYLDVEKMKQNSLHFADYNELRAMQNNPQEFEKNYRNITEQIAGNAKIIHYLADTKPWNPHRKQAAVYQLFDPFYEKYKEEMEREGI